ncbi:hypothetical protein [Leptospira inadai]|uniref:Lipoprotein n=1 Tax=Leptospira inadai serovar Lyme TaxID=293084 RepID=A0ABX4YEH8_9LEPT|nr:hypothetical protein [Leptospira inadai]PNV73285.1 hypothetical protein BES34_017460 [Leptospira inadai serovar Lyme]
MNLYIRIGAVLSFLLFLSCNNNTNNLYGTGKNNHNKDNNCKAASALYLACLNANGGAAYAANCNTQYLVVLGACSGGSGSGGGGGGGY